MQLIADPIFLLPHNMYDAHEDDSQYAGPSGQYDSMSGMGSIPQEFEVSVEVYVSMAATKYRKVRAMATLRTAIRGPPAHAPAQLQPLVPRKKSEKRDSLRNMPSSSDLGQRKIKGTAHATAPRAPHRV